MSVNDDCVVIKQRRRDLYQSDCNGFAMDMGHCTLLVLRYAMSRKQFLLGRPNHVDAVVRVIAIQTNTLLR